jgi:hypothetical protein
MGRALIWVESLAAVLLLVAAAAAWAVRRRRGFDRWGVPLAVAAAVAVPAGCIAFGLGYLQHLGAVSFGSFAAAAAWTVAFLVGSVAVIASAPRANADPPAPGARPWPAGPLAAAFAAAAILTGITVSNLDVAVKGQLAAVRVEAGARALAIAPPRLPDSQNAAPIYLRAFAALTPKEQLPTLLGNRAQAWQSYDRSALDPGDREQREFLESQQRGLGLLREAAAMPQCTFDRDWSSDTSPLDILIPELPQLRHGATLLSYDALARATRGDSRGAVDDVAAIFGIARHVHYPLLIDVVTAVAIEKTGAAALEDVLTLAPPKPGDLDRLKAAGGEPFRQQYRRALGMEEAWGLAAFSMVATGMAQNSPDINAVGLDALGAALLDTPLYRVFFLEEDLASYRRHMRSFRSFTALPGPAELDALEKVEDTIRATRGGGILAGTILPASIRGTLASLDGDATRDLVRLAVAATAHKAKHGQYPAKLRDLVPEFIPEVPLDPFDGRPIRLRRADGLLVLYSIGQDRKDDGGRPWDDQKRDGDRVFRLR